MKDNTPRASIHVGDNKKSFSAAEGNEAERRDWDERRYHLKNADKEKNNHYDFSRKKLNFEIIKGGKIVPLGYYDTPLHERLQERLHDLGFKPYMDTKHPDKVADNSPNCTLTIIFGGDHDTLYNLAFGSQNVDTENPNTDNSNTHLEQGIIDWATDTYKFACERWGEDNIISFAVHCDETSIHAHVQTVPTAMIKTRGRGSVAYRKKSEPSVELSTKEWKLLSKEERSDYEKVQVERKAKETVSFAKVWGETPSALSATLRQMHTDYHDKVGYKYGLERGQEYDELTDEEKRNRKHKDKVTLEAERQARLAMENAKIEASKAEEQKVKAEQALDNIKEYAVLATIDKKELSFPILNIEKDIKDAKDGVARELSVPIPALLGQKAWREKCTSNITAIIDTLVAAFDAAREKQNDGVKKSVNSQYTYYMQHLNKLIKENQSLRSENDSIKAENSKNKKRISQLDEHAVQKITNEKNAVIAIKDARISDLEVKQVKLTEDNNALQSKYNALVGKWNVLWQEPEFKEANNAVIKRKAAEKEQQEREVQDCKERKCKILDQFISEGRECLVTFAKGNGIQFDDTEACRIYYGVVASAIKNNISLYDNNGVSTATDSLLSGIMWSGCSEFRKSCVTNWTKLFTSKDANFKESIIENFVSFIDTMSCNQDNYMSLCGSNGCADQLTNWDGSLKPGLSGTGIRSFSNVTKRK